MLCNVCFWSGFSDLLFERYRLGFSFWSVEKNIEVQSFLFSKIRVKFKTAWQVSVENLGNLHRYSYTGCTVCKKILLSWLVHIKNHVHWCEVRIVKLSCGGNCPRHRSCWSNRCAATSVMNGPRTSQISRSTFCVTWPHSLSRDRLTVTWPPNCHVTS
jgi:hypothetical protein